MKLSAENISKSFGDKLVLNGVTLCAEGGKALGLLGRNGAGKTTTIRIIMRVFAADSGSVLLDGEPFNPEKVRIGYLPEERGLYPKKKIMQQLIYFAELAGLSKEKAIENADRLLSRLGMQEYADKKLETLSKGNQQKIQLAATLISDPDIVILDEPFSGLDPVNAKILEDLIKELIADSKIVIFSSHQMNYIEEFCDEIAILNGGKIVIAGNIRSIKKSFERTNIEIVCSNTQKIADFIKTVDADIVENVQTEDDTISIKLRKADDKARLLESLSGYSADIDSFTVKEPTLNEIFVKYTQE
jgi:ABC-2 type transport system ATP-binding protein